MCVRVTSCVCTGDALMTWTFSRVCVRVTSCVFTGDALMTWRFSRVCVRVTSCVFTGDALMTWTFSRMCVRVIDAAKRRQLPPWIRDGLEKMEREKQRQLEKEKQIQDTMSAKRLQEDVEREEQNANKDLTPAVKSRFVCIVHLSQFVTRLDSTCMYVIVIVKTICNAHKVNG